MATTDSSPTLARPIPGATWQAHVLDAGVITGELSRLWARVNAATPPPAPVAEWEEAPAIAFTRASTLNLTAVGRSRADAARVERAITRLSHLYPSRATILIASPEISSADGGGLDVHVSLLEQAATKRHPAVRFECVTVEVDASNERHLASIVAPLLLADLPDFLWWAADTSIGSDLFQDLGDASDRLIVDTAAAPKPGAELRHLIDMPRHNAGGRKLGDFAWQRLHPWRQLITQFFDHAASRPALDVLDDVQISYGSALPGGQTGLSGALLLAGWLGSSLGWQSPGELVRSRVRPGEWRGTLRAGTAAERREVALTISPVEDPVADSGLASVLLLADGGVAGSFRIERFDSDELATISQAPGRPTSRRMIYAVLPDEATLLAGELRHFGRDGVFEAALKFGAALAPFGA